MVTREIQLNNTSILERMNTYKDAFFELKEQYGVEEGISLKTEIPNVGNEYYCTDNEFLLEMIDQQNNHEGFPTSYYSINMPLLKRVNPKVWEEYVNSVKNDAAQILGAHTSALALYYPPEGFVGWHTNWNSASYQILFTWSETGEGYFRYKDPKTGDIVTLQDKPGWNVRYHYFGSKEEPEHVLWHTAYTKCPRFSFAYKYENNGKNSAHDSTILSIVEDVIWEIQQDNV